MKSLVFCKRANAEYNILAILAGVWSQVGRKAPRNSLRLNTKGFIRTRSCVIKQETRYNSQQRHLRKESQKFVARQSMPLLSQDSTSVFKLWGSSTTFKKGHCAEIQLQQYKYQKHTVVSKASLRYRTVEVDDLQTFVVDISLFVCFQSRTRNAKWPTAEGVILLPFLIPQDNSANGVSQGISPKHRNSRCVLCLW